MEEGAQPSLRLANLSSKRIAYFVSDHGYGHAARSATVILELWKRGATVVVVSKVGRWFFEETLPTDPRISYFEEKTDVGVFQETSLSINFEKTVEELEKHWAAIPGKVDYLAGVLSKCFDGAGVEKIAFDIPALAPLVAERLGVPSIALTNFTWHFIYEPYISQFPRLKCFCDLHKEAYAKASLFIEYPYSDATFPHCPSRKVNWLGRKSLLSREEVLNRLGVRGREGEGEKKYCLYSFGGHAFPMESINKLRIPEDWVLILVQKKEPGGSGEGSEEFSEHNNEGVVLLSHDELEQRRLLYVDMVGAVDVVVCKTGYGIVGECIMHGTSVLYTDRPGFVEHKTLERALNENVSCGLVEVDEVVSCQPSLWEKANAVVPNRVTPSLAFDGSEQAADIILSF